MIEKNSDHLVFKIISSCSVLVLGLISITQVIDLSTAFTFGGGRLPYSFILFIVFVSIFNFLIMITIWWPNILGRFSRIRQYPDLIGWVLATGFILLFCYFFYGSKWSHVFTGNGIRIQASMMILFVSAWFVSRDERRILDWNRLLIIILLFGTFQIFAGISQRSIDYPFRLYWSEGNRFYDYSLMFGKDLYTYYGDEPLKASSIASGRQFVWGLPFIFPGVSIKQFRLWNELVFIVPYFILGIVALRSEKWETLQKGKWLLPAFWILLFINQGPVYTPLILTAIIVLLLRKIPFWLYMISVGLAGYFAYISRYTWFPAPGMWAVLIIFLDPHIRTQRERWKKGILIGFAGLTGGYIVPKIIRPLINLISSPSNGINNIGGFDLQGMVYDQPLLWERLWPNPTYAPGIVLGLLIAAGPLTILLAYLIISGRWKLDFWQKLVILACQTAFLIVGLIISVKIGGGSNLHNLDMFLVGLIVILSLGIIYIPGEWLISSERPSWKVSILMLMIISIPSFQGILKAEPTDLPGKEITDDYLLTINEEIEKASQEGEVLFIDNRHLLTFQYVKDIPVIPEYEKKFMMDNAMGNNGKYFEGFYDDLRDRRFSAIMSEPLENYYQGGKYDFGNENDAWVKWVSIPILCYYEPVITYSDAGVEVLYPRDLNDIELDQKNCFPEN